MVGPLDGIKVLNCGTAGVGPWAATLLGYLGAEVIKIERPGGELTRVAYPRRGAVSSAFLALNINQQALQLDLKQDGDRETFEQLVTDADVLIENYRPGVADRIGMGYERVSALNPGLVMASSPGWGHSGPMRDQGAVDPHLQAFSGFAGLNGLAGDEPEMLRYTHIDPNGSVHLAALVLLGLLQRQRTGRGSYVRSSHLAMALFMQSTRIAETLTTSAPVQRMGSACASSVPNQCFLASDNNWLAVSVETQGQWSDFCSAIGLDELCNDERFASNALRVRNRAQLIEDLTDVFAQHPQRWWLSRFETHNVPHSRLLEFDDLRYHQQVRANDYLVEVESAEGPLTLGGLPWRFSRTPANIVPTRPHPGDKKTVPQFSAGAMAPVASQQNCNDDTPPLAGLSVIDASQGYAAPLVALLLAEAGAIVTKLEPSGGDWTKDLEPRTQAGTSAAYAAMNRNKLRQSVDKLDVVAVNNLLSTADLVISDESAVMGPFTEMLAAASEARPELIQLQVSHFGDNGPMAGQAATELTIQAMTGYLTDLGMPGGEPVRVGADITGTCSAALSFLGTLAALYERGQSGRGQVVATSLLGSMMCMRTLRWANHDRPDEWKGGDCSSKTDTPWRGYKTLDGVIWPTLRTVRNDEDVLNIYRDLGMYEEVSQLDVFMREGRDSVGLGYQAQKVKPIWDRYLGQLTTSYVLDVFNKYRGIAVEFSELHNLVDHPQVQSLDLLAEAGGERFVRAPWLTNWQRPAVKPLQDESS
jgi:crotonobetainyl-CoA:carnitine CoA-transferase CaiB-like acyl-CoA transferase